MSSLTDSDGDLYLHLTPTLRSLALRGVVQTHPKKAILINEGEEGDSLWILLKGSVKAFAVDENGREITYGKIDAGDYFGEMSLLDERPRSATAAAMDPVRVHLLYKTELEKLVKHVPAIGAAIMAHLAMLLAARLRSMTDQTPISLAASVSTKEIR